MIAEELGTLVESFTYESLPDDVIETAKSRILDYIGMVIAGYELGSADSLLKIYNRPGNCTVFGYGEKLDIRDAAVLNGFMAHSTWYEDGSRITGGHPSSSIFPALIALAEQRNASGSDVLAATIAGYEVFNRVGAVMYPATVRHGFQPTGLLAPIASAAACSRLLCLPTGGVSRAIGIASPLGSGLKSAFKGGDAQPIQIGRASEAGLVAALMAEEGFKGYAGNLEAFLVAHDTNPGMSVCVDASMNYQIKNTYVKVHAGCRGNHAPLDAVLNLLEEHPIQISDIEKIEIEVDTITAANEIHNPRNRNDAQFNIPFSVAVALQKGNALLFNFSDENVNNPEIQSLMNRVKVITNPELNKLLPNKRGAVGRLVLRDGSIYSTFIDMPKGEPENPLSFEQIAEKFCLLTEKELGSRAKYVVEIVQDLNREQTIHRLISALN